MEQNPSSTKFGPIDPATADLDPATFGIPTPPPTPPRKPGHALVTGASTGIGWDTVVALRQAGWMVTATARRRERLAGLARLTGCRAFAADLADLEQVRALYEYATSPDPVTTVINNAGGALGSDPVASGEPEKWREMYDRNVISALQVTQAFLPHLLENGGGDLVYVTSTAAISTYPGGAGYTAAKHAEQMLPQTLRLELVGKPVRVIEVLPGLVQTPEFSLTRLGDSARAEQVYSQVKHPLVGADIAGAITWAVSLPAHVNIDQVVIRPVEQATSTLQRRLED